MMAHARCPLCGEVHQPFSCGFAVSLYRSGDDGEFAECPMNGFDCEMLYGPDVDEPDAETYEEAVEKAYALWDRAFGGGA